MRWLNTCKFDKLHPVMVLAINRIDEIYKDQGKELWLTSVNDRTHKDGSKHYDGKAVDCRSHVFENPQLVTMYIKNALGPQFTVILEEQGLPNEHIHVQFNGE